MDKLLKSRKQMSMAWYIKLNILVLSFLFIVFLMKETSSTSFKRGLGNIFKSEPIRKPERSARIRVTSKKAQDSHKKAQDSHKKAQDSQ